MFCARVSAWGRAMTDDEAKIRELRQRIADLEHERDEYRALARSLMDQGASPEQAEGPIRLFGLSPMPSLVLLTLYRRQPRIVSRDTMMTVLYQDNPPPMRWRKNARGGEYARIGNSVDVYVWRIRRKIAELGLNAMVETVPRCGWRLIDPDAEIAAEVDRQQIS